MSGCVEARRCAPHSVSLLADRPDELVSGRNAFYDVVHLRVGHVPDELGGGEAIIHLRNQIAIGVVREVRHPVSGGVADENILVRRGKPEWFLWRSCEKLLARSLIQLDPSDHLRIVGQVKGICDLRGQLQLSQRQNRFVQTELLQFHQPK